MRYVSLFSGIGGFDLALQRQGHTCVYANDFDKYCKIIYDKHFETKLDTRSITTVSEEEIPEHELLVGGFPCQAFSIAGQRRGFADTRGTLFFDVARILRSHHPRICLLENVKGLLSHDHGYTFKTIISTLDELGYDCQWQVLNSKNFGVPQNRERVFIIGYLRGTGRRQIFPLTGTNKPIDSTLTSTTIDANYFKGIDNHGARTGIGELKYLGAIMSDKNKQWLDDGKQLSRNFPQGQRVYTTDGISSTLASQAGGLGAKTGLYAMQWRRTEKGKEARKESMKSGKDYTPFGDGHRELVPKPGKMVGALTAQAMAKDSLIGNAFVIRRLTPTECERLQGFPDGWTEGVSDTQRYKQLGNAVTVNVVEEIIKRMELTT